MEHYSLGGKVHYSNTQGIILFCMFYEIVHIFNMLLNTLNSEKVKMPLKCDYTSLVAFLLRICAGLFKK